MESKTSEELAELVEQLQVELDEARDTIEAIHSGKIDALAVKAGEAIKIYTVEGADTAFRVLVETMSEGAVTLGENGLILYTNRVFPDMLGLAPEEMTGRYIREFIPERSEAAFNRLLESPGRAELELMSADGTYIPTLVSSNTFDVGDLLGKCLVVTDLTEQKKAERERASELERMVSERTAELRAANERLDFQATLLRNMNDAVVASDTERRLTMWNPAAERVYGWKASEVLGKQAMDVLQTRWLDQTPEDVYRAIVEKGSIKAEIQQKTKDGGDIWVESVLKALYDEDGHMVGQFGVNRDITERKRAEAELNQFRSVVSSAGEGIAVTDPAGNITYANNTLARIAGVRPEELTGRPMMNIGFSPDDLERLEVIIPASVQERGGWSGEVQLHRADGSSIFVLLNVGKLTDDRGLGIGGIVMMTDITGLKDAEERLRAANQELDSYAHTVSHDLRSPLTAVILANELMRDAAHEDDLDEVRAEIEESTGTIGRNISKAYALINDLLTLAESGQRPARVTDVDINEVVDRVLEERTGEIADRGLAVHKDTGLGKIKASETQIYQIFSNLIGNTIRHNDNPMPEVWIRHLGETEHGHRYLVRDNSYGIPEDQLKNIFTPFYKREAAGSVGIGLTIVKKIIEVYSGYIKAYNDNGACFEFTVNDYRD